MNMGKKLAAYTELLIKYGKDSEECQQMKWENIHDEKFSELREIIEQLREALLKHHYSY